MRDPVPLGAGLIARRLRLDRRSVYVLGGILAGEDHLASIHGEAGDDGARVTVALVTTEARAAELDAWIDELAEELGIERLP